MKFAVTRLPCEEPSPGLCGLHVYRLTHLIPSYDIGHKRVNLTTKVKVSGREGSDQTKKPL